jgi:hypothetical protein
MVEESMIRKRAMLAMLAALTVGGIAVPLVANADATDTGAIVTEAQDIASATANNAQQVLNDPNTTCNLKAAGDNVEQRTNFVVGELFTQDLGTATGECVSFNAASYSAKVTMNVQAYIPVSGVFKWVTFCSTFTSASSVEGVAQPLPAERLCQITAPSIYLNRYHRVQAIITNTRAQTFYDYSPIWFDTP